MCNTYALFSSILYINALPNRIKFRAVGRQKQHKQPLCLPGWPKCLHRLALVNRAIILNDKGELAGLGPLLSRFGGEPVHHFDIALAIEATDCEGIVEALIRIPYPENADSLASARCLLKPFLLTRETVAITLRRPLRTPRFIEILQGDLARGGEGF